MRRFTSIIRLATVLLAAAACADRDPTAPAMPVSAPVPAAAAVLRCSVAVRSGTLSCSEVRAGGPSSARSAVLGGQGTNVRLASSGTIYDGTFLHSDVTVQNLTSQALGTANGFTASAEGVRVFFASGPSVTAGTGAVSVDNPDGTAVFTAAGQPYFQYDEILFPGDVSAAHEWRFRVDATVVTFAFTVLVAAEVPNEAGWVDVAPLAPSLQVGDTVRMSAAVRTVAGSPLPGSHVTWTTSDMAVAVVDSAGRVTAVGAGNAAITATSGARSGRATVMVVGAAEEAPPSILSLQISPATMTATGSDFVWVQAEVSSPTGVASITFVLNGPETHQLLCYPPRISGNALNGQYRCGFVIPNGAKAGVWALTSVIASGQNSFRILSAGEIVAAGGRPFVNVRSPNEDVDAPGVTGFTLSPDTARAGVDSVVVDVSFTDAGVGAAQANVRFLDAQGGITECGTNGLSAGSPQAGTFRCRILVDADAPRGAWSIWSVEVRDYNGNVQTRRTADLQAAGFPTDFTVVDP